MGIIYRACSALSTLIRATTSFAWMLTGTNIGPGERGRAVRISGYEVWQVGSDGLIVRSSGTFDAEDYRRQLAGGK